MWPPPHGTTSRDVESKLSDFLLAFRAKWITCVFTWHREEMEINRWLCRRIDSEDCWTTSPSHDRGFVKLNKIYILSMRISFRWTQQMSRTYSFGLFGDVWHCVKIQTVTNHTSPKAVIATIIPRIVFHPGWWWRSWQREEKEFIPSNWPVYCSQTDNPLCTYLRKIEQF